MFSYDFGTIIKICKLDIECWLLVIETWRKNIQCRMINVQLPRMWGQRIPIMYGGTAPPGNAELQLGMRTKKISKKSVESLFCHIAVMRGETPFHLQYLLLAISDNDYERRLRITIIFSGSVRPLDFCGAKIRFRSYESMRFISLS